MTLNATKPQKRDFQPDAIVTAGDRELTSNAGGVDLRRSTAS